MTWRWREPVARRAARRSTGETSRVYTSHQSVTLEPLVAQNLRGFVGERSDNDYLRASDTTQELLHHWFLRDHMVETFDGDPFIPMAWRRSNWASGSESWRPRLKHVRVLPVMGPTPS